MLALRRVSTCCTRISKLRWLSAAAEPTRVCVVGTGPGGFYTAKYLLKEDPTIHVDLIDALPTPYGLVRSGVAPDHPEVKSVTNDFEAVATDPRVSFLGNVRVGEDIPLADLQRYYHAVVLAYGAATDRLLGVPGEAELRNVFSARAFVAWYNGHPEFRSFRPNLDTEDVVIIGNGNVAVDCARILCKTVDELKSTDIAAHALEALAKSRVKRVHVVGRRGHVQAAFTMKELREVTKLADADCIVMPRELDAGRTVASKQEVETHRAKKRMDALLTEVASASAGTGKSKQLSLRFLLAPTKLVPSASDPTAVGGVECAVTSLTGPADEQRALVTDARETLPAGMVLRSIGYKSVPLAGVPFNTAAATVNHQGGRVMHPDGIPAPGLYVSGWLKRGPTGIIGTNIPDARETVAAIIEDKAAGALPPIAAVAGAAADAAGGSPAEAPGIEGVRAFLLTKKGKRTTDIVSSWGGFKQIDKEEMRRGAAAGRPREKLTDITEMLAVANGHASSSGGSASTTPRPMA